MLFGLVNSPRHSRRYAIKRSREYRQSIVRECFHQRELEQLAGGRTAEGHELETTADVVLEDRNSRDNKAVRIDIDNKTVGYLAGNDARRYRQWLRDEGYPDGVIIECPALITGGWDRGPTDRGPFSIRLDLPLRETPRVN